MLHKSVLCFMLRVLGLHCPIQTCAKDVTCNILHTGMQVVSKCVFYHYPDCTELLHVLYPKGIIKYFVTGAAVGF